jgi:hypothetical protein
MVQVADPPSPHPLTHPFLLIKLVYQTTQPAPTPEWIAADAANAANTDTVEGSEFAVSETDLIKALPSVTTGHSDAGMDGAGAVTTASVAVVAGEAEAEQDTSTEGTAYAARVSVSPHRRGPLLTN